MALLIFAGLNLLMAWGLRLFSRNSLRSTQKTLEKIESFSEFLEKVLVEKKYEALTTQYAKVLDTHPRSEKVAIAIGFQSMGMQNGFAVAAVLGQWIFVLFAIGLGITGAVSMM